ncbi:hypothetical protein CsatB_001808 [Cannabis sativa]
MLVVIFSSMYDMAFIKLSRDDGPQIWIKIEPYFCSFDVIHFKGLFYAIINDGTLRSFDLRSPCVDSTVRELAREIPLPHLGLKRYLVESYGHIILVERFFRWDIKDEIRRTWRYCMESNNWIHMKSLGEMALFLGDNSSVSVLATRFNGIQPNCIYFTHDEDVICG